MTATDRARGLSGWMAGRSKTVFISALVLTGLLAIPFLTMQPETSASQEPSGEVFAARDYIEDEFVSSVFSVIVIAEDLHGDMLRQEPLLEVLAAEQAVRDDPDIGPTLFTYFDGDELAQVQGIASIADLIDRRLPNGIAGATDTEIKQVAAALIAARGPSDVGLSAQTTAGPDGLPVSPAIFIPVLADDTILGFGGGGVRLGTETESEEYSRDVLEILRSDEDVYEAWGIAIDVNLTSAEQGAIAGPFIGFTILAVLLIVGLTFRSYWVLAVTGAALAALIVWLQGITNLIGFEDDLILSLIVPIAMVSFGVDFTFHAVGRYREQRLEGMAPRAAFVTGIAAVAGALVLALASDSAAFLSNTTAGIESIVQFGIGAAIALVAAFLLLGLVTPLAVMRIEEKIGTPEMTRGRRIRSVTGMVFASLFAMASVILSVFILPVAGLIVLAVYLIFFLALPYRLSRPGEGNGKMARQEPGRPTRMVGSLIAAITRWRRVVLPAVAIITVVAVSFMVRVESEFDVKDFFASDTDFVTSLDKLDEHGGANAGEGADVLIQADLSDPRALATVATFADGVRALDSPHLLKTDEGETRLDTGVLEVIDEVWTSPVAVSAIEQATGVVVTDADGDGLPDTREQLLAVYGFTREAGVPFDTSNLLLTPDDVHNVLSADYSTRMQVGIPGSREVENIKSAQDDIRPLVDELEAALQAFDADARVTVTGGPIVRQGSLDAILQALQISLPISVILCLAIAWWFMKSFRYAVASIVPILIVVSWLYAFMYLFGFAINLVTATIGAVSIGIGIDFAIHFAMRYREELARTGVREDAVRAAGEGTGVALVASAVSSMVGFAILALAPMPLFASYGFLTAVMIAMALVASLLVLPSLLVLITKDTAPA